MEKASVNHKHKALVYSKVIQPPLFPGLNAGAILCLWISVLSLDPHFVHRSGYSLQIQVLSLDLGFVLGSGFFISESGFTSGCRFCLWVARLSLDLSFVSESRSLGCNTVSGFGFCCSFSFVSGSRLTALFYCNACESSH